MKKFIIGSAFAVGVIGAFAFKSNEHVSAIKFYTKPTPITCNLYTGSIPVNCGSGTFVCTVSGSATLYVKDEAAPCDQATQVPRHN